MFGWIDIVAIRKDEIIGIQSTSQPQKSKHLKELRGIKKQSVEDWISAGGKAWLVTWSMKREVGSGSKRKKWNPTVTQLYNDGGLKEMRREKPQVGSEVVDISSEAPIKYTDDDGTEKEITEVLWPPADSSTETTNQGEQNDRTNECNRDKEIVQEKDDYLFTETTCNPISGLGVRGVVPASDPVFESEVPGVQSKTSRRLNKNRNNKRVHKTK